MAAKTKKLTATVFGYKRLGKNLETVIDSGIKWAKSSGAIVANGKLFELAGE